MIFYDFRKGLAQQYCLVRLCESFGCEAPSEKTVYYWFAEFCHGRAYVSDESHEGRPKSVVIPNNIDAVRKMIKEDRHVTHHEMFVHETLPRKLFFFSSSAIQDISQLFF